jgi:aminoglycoside phosphotransferase (APT) family kinase protein
LVPYATGRWSTWFPGERPPTLEVGVLIEPNHQHRPLVFLIPGSARTPRVVLKVALTKREAGFLGTEFQVLSQLRPMLPAGLRESIPDPLGLERTADRTVLVLRGMEGRRPLPPRFSRRPSVGGRAHLVRFIDSAFGWTRRLADATSRPTEVDEAALSDRVARFGAAFAKNGNEAQALRSFGRAVENTRIRWTPSWQHGDIGFGNALIHRGRVSFVDWEQARPSSEPWFDVSYLPLALAGMARRQRDEPSLQRATAWALAPGGWTGSIIRAQLRQRWDYPLPIAWAITLTSMWKALRLQREGRVGWADLALGLVVDADLRREIAWMAPQW